MVCDRCIRVVKEDLSKLGLKIYSVELGKVEVDQQPDEEMLQKIKAVLEKEGFELMSDKKTRIVSSIKTEIIKLTRDESNTQKLKFSEYISAKLNHDYSYISNLFSELEGITIEKFAINKKVEYIKELIIYDELSLNEISYKLGYSSVQYLSSQFKKITGLTPTDFKKLHLRKNR
jgi:YesN/AraC family two-component response regulator